VIQTIVDQLFRGTITLDPQTLHVELITSSCPLPPIDLTGHPVDVLKEFMRRMGYQLDPAYEAHMRAYCDEEVPA
jgi:hypothetical protein